MGRTGARAAALDRAMCATGYVPATVKPSPPRTTSFADELAAAMATLYRDLGGVNVEPALRPGSWDLAYADGLVVELDEELHFNRYRLLTIDRPWATALPWHEAYRRLCVDREPDCLRAARWGKRWTNPSCEQLFGVADQPGTFGPVGAPRWKQRALYDAMKDAWAISTPEHRLARVSVHDEIGGVLVEDALRARATLDPRNIGRGESGAAGRERPHWGAGADGESQGVGGNAQALGDPLLERAHDARGVDLCGPLRLATVASPAR